MIYPGIPSQNTSTSKSDRNRTFHSGDINKVLAHLNEEAQILVHEVASLAKPIDEPTFREPLGEPIVRNVAQEIVSQHTGDVSPVEEVGVRFLKDFVKLVCRLGPNHARQLEEGNDAERRIPNVGVTRDLFFFASSKRVQMNQRIDGRGRERIVVLDGLVHVVMVVIVPLFEGLLHGELVLFDHVSFVHV